MSWWQRTWPVGKSQWAWWKLKTNMRWAPGTNCFRIDSRSLMLDSSNIDVACTTPIVVECYITIQQLYTESWAGWNRRVRVRWLHCFWFDVRQHQRYVNFSRAIQWSQKSKAAQSHLDMSALSKALCWSTCATFVFLVWLFGSLGNRSIVAQYHHIVGLPN